MVQSIVVGGAWRARGSLTNEWIEVIADGKAKLKLINCSTGLCLTVGLVSAGFEPSRSIRE